MFGLNLFKDRSATKNPPTRPIGGFQFGADTAVKINVIDADAEQKKLEEDLEIYEGKIEDKFTRLEELDKALALMKKDEVGGERMQKGIETYAEIVKRWEEIQDEYEKTTGKTQAVLDGFKKIEADLEQFEKNIEIWKAEKKERDEFLAEDRNKSWEDIMAKANDEVKVIAVTKEYFEAKNPDLKLTENFNFDLREKIEQYVSQSEEHVDAFHENEKKLFLKIFAASKMINDKKLPKTCLIIEGKTYMVDTAAFEAARNENKIRLEGEPETDDEKEDRTKYSRAGAEITLQRVEKFEDLNVVDSSETEPNKGDKVFLEKTREVWKKFAVHGFPNKDPKAKDPILAYTDLDGKCCLELLKLAGIDTSDLKYVAQGSSEEGRINLDTGGKDGVVAENFDNVNEEGYVSTAFIDHHDPKESKQNSSAAMHMYRTLVDLGLLQKSEALDRTVAFTTMVDSGEYPDVENKYFQNSDKTMIGLARYVEPSSLVRFFKRNKRPDPLRELSERELKLYELVIPEKRDKSGKVIKKEINRSLEQKNIREISLKKLEQMEQEGFIVESDRYGKILINIEDKSNGKGNRNLPGSFLAARAYGCGTYINWNPEEKRFIISSKVPISEEFPQGLKVRETMIIKNGESIEELQMKLGEILNALTDGKLDAQGKLKEYLDSEKATPGIEPVAAAAAIEEPREKTPEDFFNELRAELKVFSVERYQVLYNKMMDVAEKNGVAGEEKKKLVADALSGAIEDDVTLYTRKRGEEVKKVLEYILSQIK